MDDKKYNYDLQTGLEIKGRTKDETHAAKIFSARCGHVKRQLKLGEPLKDKTLELALEYAQDDEVKRKLEAGEELNEYEYHILVEVRMLHARLCYHPII